MQPVLCVCVCVCVSALGDLWEHLFPCIIRELLCTLELQWNVLEEFYCMFDKRFVDSLEFFVEFVLSFGEVIPVL